MDTINKNLIKAKYEVRGGIVLRGEELRKEMEKGKKMPFENIVSWNIGNPQALGQVPISFPREVIGYLYSGLASDLYSSDAINRGDTYKSEIKHMEQYTHFKGLEIVRRNIAKFIETRDNCKTDPEDIFLSNGASGGIKIVLQTLLEDERDTVLAPIPQYPLYSACIQLLGANLAGYYLEEDKEWSVSVSSLEKVYKANESAGNRSKCMVVINPGNPTGNILSEDNIADIIKFCYDHNLAILADEVYQANIYSDNKKFHSFKSVLNRLPAPYNETILFSFHSVSKGYFGECGLRGGYTDMFNVPEEMKRAIFKLKALEICPNIIGQLTMDLLVNPPTRETCNENTVVKYNEEVEKIQADMKERALIMTKKLNNMKGFKSNEIEGAMYAFPNIDMPESVIEKAKEMDMKPDYYYALKLLENTGLMTVAGSGFGQKEGSYHIRLTNLIQPKEELLKTLNKIEEFNNDFFKS